MVRTLSEAFTLGILVATAVGRATIFLNSHCI